ncbi:hypothetical protein [Aequorivita sinensis]|uniref:hypothetical protein n=1 Tax=Aequorivita sinensis TaxID=1382458 RepID=UPI001123F7BB|nr:hypothetical protein [Aequorivita sinensis]
MKKSTFYILAFFSTLALCCKSELKNKDFDEQKTTEFFKQILQKEEILRTNCVLETSTWKLSKFEDDFKKYIKKHLKIKDTSHLNLQINLFKGFIVTKEIASGKNILKKEDYINFNQTSENNEYGYLDWLEQHHCKRGFNSISKPLFNETYDLAIVHIDEICGPMCGGNWTIAYEFKNEEWIRKEIIDATVK